jgi:hypothetical protein
MPKYLCAGRIPSRWLNRVFHANPERLRGIACEWRTASAAERARLAAEFSDIVRDIRIRGVWKRTAPGRLRESERALCAALAARTGTALHVLDLGASDAVTTVELVRALRSTGAARVHAVAADRDLVLVPHRRGPVVEYRATDGEPVLLTVGRLAVRLPRSEHRWHVASTLVAGAYLRWGSRFRRSLAPGEPISLLSPVVVVDEPSIEIVAMDCLAEHADFHGRFDAIRASNLLNPRNFGVAELRRILVLCHRYLREGGCVVISRNEARGAGEVERGAVWSRTPTGFRLSQTFSGGSEIDELVASVHVSAVCPELAS